MNNSMKHGWKSTLDATLPTRWQAWLLHAGSFMAHIRSKNIHDASVHVLSEQWMSPEPWEIDCLPETMTSALIREVLISSHDRHWMYARTVIPKETLTGDLAILGQLQNKPIGSILFNHPDMQRSAFEFTCVTSDMTWHHKIQSCINEDLPSLWTRRSVFTIQQKSILLTESFLPDVLKL